MGSDHKKPDGNIEIPREVLAPGERKETVLPKIAEKADDLEEIKKAVEDAASVSGGLWLSYLFVLSYVAIAAGAITHEDLLLERAVKLPFLNVELPLLAFFALAPFVLLITHIHALMHFRMLGKKATRFHNELRSQFPDRGTAPAGTNKEIRDKKRWLLPSNIFVQTLAGPPELRTGFFGVMLKIIALTTLVAFPVLVLLLLQIQFLPFHDVRITWAQRGALFLDLVLLWPLRPPILADLSAESSGRAQLFSRILRGFGLAIAFVMSLAAIWFSFVVATVPGEWRSFPLSYVAAIEPKTLTNTVFGTVWPTNTLHLQGFDIYEALKVDDPKKLEWKDYIFDLHSRQLGHAILDRARLGKVKLKDANLEDASLLGAELQGASLAGAQLPGASLGGAQLRGASLAGAQLQGASLDGAAVNTADFLEALLWRTTWGEIDRARIGEIRLTIEDRTWSPVWEKDPPSNPRPWNAEAYRRLRDSMNTISDEHMRDKALKRIETLNCSKTGEVVASCNPAADPPPKVWYWQKTLAAASVDDTAYAKALAKELRGLVCANDTNAIYILRGIMRTLPPGPLAATGPEASALVKSVMGNDKDKPCPASAALTDDDKARLLEIRQDAEK